MNTDRTGNRRPGRGQGKGASGGPKTIDLKASKVADKREEQPGAAESEALERDATGESKRSHAAGKAEFPTSENAEESPTGSRGTGAEEHIERPAGGGEGETGGPRAWGRNGASAGRSSWQLPLAAFAGGVVALLLFALLNLAGLNGWLEPDGSEDEARLEALLDGQQIDRDSITEIRENLQAQLSQLRSEIAEMDAAPGPQPGPSEERIESLTSTVAELDSGLRAYGERLEALQESLSAQAPPPGVADPVADSRLAEIVERLETLESDAGTPGAPQPGVDTRRLADLEGQLAEVRRGVESDAEQLQMMDQRFADIDSALGEIRDRLGAFETQLAEQEQRGDQLARRFAANALANATLRGEPVGGLLESLGLLGVGQERLVELRESIAAMEPKEELFRDLENLASDMIAAGENGARGDADGLMAQLVENARDLVSVRPSVPIEGDTTPAIVSRIEAAMEAGDLQRAASVWQQLPAPAKAASQAWYDRLEQRIAAERQLKELISELMAG
jgi:hypothetical protein